MSQKGKLTAERGGAYFKCTQCGEDFRTQEKLDRHRRGCVRDSSSSSAAAAPSLVRSSRLGVAAVPGDGGGAAGGPSADSHAGIHGS